MAFGVAVDVAVGFISFGVTIRTHQEIQWRNKKKLPNTIFTNSFHKYFTEVVFWWYLNVAICTKLIQQQPIGLGSV